MKKNEATWRGLLVIGDPHIEGRSPDYRSDNYAETILAKLQWCLDYARDHQLLPTLLGDLFDKPRDNPTWLIGHLIEMMRERRIIGIYGNHDCAEPTLSDNDSLSILIKAGCLQRVSAAKPWRGQMCGRPVLIGGSSYREVIPKHVSSNAFKRDSLFPETPLGIWLTHHDIAITGYEGGRFAPFEIENIDLLINGHIHTRSEPVEKGNTTWLTPGNISRRSRSENCRSQKPAALEITLGESDYQCRYIEIPHKPFDDVFHPPVFDSDTDNSASAFVAGLRELRLRKTSTGVGLNEFLKKNLEHFSPPVAEQIMSLAADVTRDPEPQPGRN